MEPEALSGDVPAGHTTDSQGETLEARVARSGRLPPSTVVRLLRQAAAELALAHRAGVVDGRLHPSRLLLIADPTLPGGERLKIVERSDEPSGTGLEAGVFLAPEQRGDEASVDERADVYALGAIAYNLLSARLPVDAPPQREARRSQRPMRLLEAGVEAPVSVEAAVMQCVEPSPEARFQSMEELLQALPDEEEMRGWPEASPPPRSEVPTAPTAPTAPDLDVAPTAPTAPADAVSEAPAVEVALTVTDPAVAEPSTATPALPADPGRRTGLGWLLLSALVLVIAAALLAGLLILASGR